MNYKDISKKAEEALKGIEEFKSRDDIGKIYDNISYSYDTYVRMQILGWIAKDAEIDSFLELQYERMIEAQKFWQEETGNDHLEDLGKLMKWFITELKEKNKEIKSLLKASKKAEAYMTEIGVSHEYAIMKNLRKAIQSAKDCINRKNKNEKTLSKEN